MTSSEARQADADGRAADARRRMAAAAASALLKPPSSMAGGSGGGVEGGEATPGAKSRHRAASTSSRRSRAGTASYNGTVVVRVMSAERLRAADKSGTSDPYCLVKVQKSAACAKIGA